MKLSCEIIASRLLSIYRTLQYQFYKMTTYSKVLLVLKDADNHMDYNKRIIEYLNDRHTAINDNKFTIAIEVADDNNINDFVLEGVESLPAIRVSEEQPFTYGVNSILAALAKLEVIKSNFANGGDQKQSKENYQNANSEDDCQTPFYDMVMQEMQCEDQEDPDAPSTVKAYHQDLPETPLNERSIEEKAKQYNKIYEQRRNRGPQRAPQKKQPSRSPGPSPKMNVDSFIAKGGYDKGEELIMRQIAQNL